MTPKTKEQIIQDLEDRNLALQARIDELEAEIKRLQEQLASNTPRWVKTSDRQPEYNGMFHVTIEDLDKNRTGAFIENFMGAWVLPTWCDMEDEEVVEWLEEEI